MLGEEEKLNAATARVRWRPSEEVKPHKPKERSSSPEGEREPDDGQPHHVLPHGVVEALHQIQVDLQAEQRC